MGERVMLILPLKLLQVMVVVGVLAVFSFSGGVAAAVEGENWQEQIDRWEEQGAVIFSRGQRIPKNLAATAVSESIMVLYYAIVYIIMHPFYCVSPSVYPTKRTLVEVPDAMSLL